MSTAVVGTVHSVADAEALVSQLQRAPGVEIEDISLLLPDAAREGRHPRHVKASEGAAMGASTGSVLGGALGLLVGIGALAVPGFGPLLAAGPVLTTLGGAAAGAAAGGVSGALTALGIPERDAKHYEGQLRGGKLLVVVHAADRQAAQLVREILESSGARVGGAARAP